MTVTVATKLAWAGLVGGKRTYRSMLSFYPTGQPSATLEGNASVVLIRKRSY